MKRIVKAAILSSSMFLMFNQVMAAGSDATASPSSTTSTTSSTSSSAQQADMNAGMWICTTNASSASSGSPEDQADKTMANNAANGTSAFEFALKNCRDCTKITCEQQTKSAQ
ncbi:hypothetical protein OQJ18_03220 [Fluoribacter dumoffii]|uniref:Uncharacterized protein n=1 Tax=Fluoribacter dumoffii TaxID=463 RepID=A0A377GA71_9GAMM|nr:hypothetical protein [Fluoribacter dumoffii]KTC88933.1 hypothetical protein Ldum_3191 [Fluoribacter dumoffii NY 23]MCW8385855.1 hypothetical protein [Fluoribacter dumoffii]MCW8418908.1 hypothetical protein [Fluoribacter dumoffii]MCW8453248.1 hypothetical protein [Fluoribacter dumoffii]MCW8459531.1 hypothetical protein [Fluoribacter dumoffii]